MDLSAKQRALHEAALAAGRPSYRDPVSGLQVLSAAFLASQGSCCRRGCRHCPYPCEDQLSPADEEQSLSA
jgi:Family of unknown function (DUF5522)